MNNYGSATAQTEQPGVDPVYLLRDDLAQVHNPINQHERMLVTAAAQNWQSLQNARALEARIAAEIGVFDLFTTRLDHFKSLTRYIANCDGMWRHSVAAIEYAKRHRAARPILRPRNTPVTPITPIRQNEPNPHPAPDEPQNEANPGTTNKRNSGPAPAPAVPNKANPSKPGATRQSERNSGPAPAPTVPNEANPDTPGATRQNKPNPHPAPATRQTRPRKTNPNSHPTPQTDIVKS